MFVIAFCYCYCHYHFVRGCSITRSFVHSFWQFRAHARKQKNFMRFFAVHSKCGCISKPRLIILNGKKKREENEAVTKQRNLFIFYQSCNNFIYQPARKPCSKWTFICKNYAHYSFYQTKQKIHMKWYRNNETVTLRILRTIYARTHKLIHSVLANAHPKTASITNENIILKYTNDAINI